MECASMSAADPMSASCFISSSLGRPLQDSSSSSSSSRSSSESAEAEQHQQHKHEQQERLMN
jgi:hypothetical protein